MLFKLSNLNSNLALTLGYLNPASNNSAQDGRKKRTANRLCVTNVERGTRKMSGDNGTSDKVVLFFPDGMFQTEIRVPFFKAIFDTSLTPSQPFLNRYETDLDKW